MSKRIYLNEIEPGVVEVRSVDPFNKFRIYRLEKDSLSSAPAEKGVYVLFGNPGGEFTTYIGQSTTSIRARLRDHEKTKQWFTTAFAIPLPHASFSKTVEAELINLADSAKSVKVLENDQIKSAYVADDQEINEVQVIVDSITEWLALLTGVSIFDPPPTREGAAGKRTENLARVYKGQAAKPRGVEDDDPAGATHSYVASTLAAWGRFMGKEPNTRFRVLKGSEWREAIVDRNAGPWKRNRQLRAEQDKLVKRGVLDRDTQTFLKDHTFPNWNKAVQTVTGRSQYSGSRTWQKIQRPRGRAAQKKRRPRRASAK